jgi:CBS domain-containing protein
MIMSLKKFLQNEQLVTCGPGTKVSECATLMRDHDVGAVVVADGNNLLGIVTDRDLVVRCLCYGRDAADRSVNEFMSRGVVMVAQDGGFQHLISLMKEKRVRRVVVCDESGAPVGIVSQGDVVKLLATELHEIALGTAPEQDKLKVAS